MKPRRLTFTVQPYAHKAFTCNRCRRAMLVGERVTSITNGDQAVTRHAGRTCPPAFQPDPITRSPTWRLRD